METFPVKNLCIKMKKLEIDADIAFVKHNMLFMQYDGPVVLWL